MKLLIMIDMQNDFTTGVLGNEETKNIISPVCNAIENYKKSSIPMIYTMDTHEDNYLQTQEGKNLPVRHCIIGTDGWERPDEIKNAMKNMTTIKVEKNTFGAKTLPEDVKKIMEVYNITSIELIGVCTDICVISNAMLLKAFFPEIEISVNAACCAGTTPAAHDRALEAMKNCQINII